MDIGMVAIGAGCAIVGGVIGLVAGGLAASAARGDLEAKISHLKQRAEDWHRQWQSVNNRLHAVRETAEGIRVMVRDKHGKVLRWESARERINGLLALEGREHEAL